MPRSFHDAHKLFVSFGATLRPQDNAVWSGPFELPAAVRSMYNELGPDNAWVPSHGNDLFIPSLAELWALQAGYRYHGLTFQPLPEWPDELLVVANQGGDPIAIDRSLGNIHFARHGSQDWKFEYLSDSLVDVVLGLGIMGSIVHEAGPRLCGSDSIVLSTHVERALADLTARVGVELARRLTRREEWTS